MKQNGMDKDERKEKRTNVKVKKGKGTEGKGREAARMNGTREGKEK